MNLHKDRERGRERETYVYYIHTYIHPGPARLPSKPKTCSCFPTPGVPRPETQSPPERQTLLLHRFWAWGRSAARSSSSSSPASKSYQIAKQADDLLMLPYARCASPRGSVASRTTDTVGHRFLAWGRSTGAYHSNNLNNLKNLNKLNKLNNLST